MALRKGLYVTHITAFIYLTVRRTNCAKRSKNEAKDTEKMESHVVGLADDLPFIKSVLSITRSLYWSTKFTPAFAYYDDHYCPHYE